MKTALSVARILTWFNLITWGGLLGLMLVFGLVSGATPVLLAVFLFSAIPLHSYAALKLQKSIRFPNIKLNSQTPVGVRFVGFVALFFGITTVFNSIVLLNDPKMALDAMNLNSTQMKGLTSAQLISVIKVISVIPILLGATVVVNVILNTRLLRWYYLVKQSDVS